jgi:RNase P subunit RPR2
MMCEEIRRSFKNRIEWLAIESALRKGKNVSELPIAVGDLEAQRRFVQRNTEFLQEFPKLMELSKKVFIRKLEAPDENAVEPLLKLSEDDPAVIAFEDKIMADRVIFYLGRMAADDFGEILTLSGNGRGFGAYKIVRGMYERVVTAMYIEKKPAEARIFVESSAISKRNYLTRLLKAIPEERIRFNDEFMQTIEQNAVAAQAKRKQSICPKCNQLITQDAWTRVRMDVMAREVEPALEVLYPQSHLDPTAQLHANMFGIERRLVRTKAGYTYKDISENEARFAVHLGHHLMVRLLGMQNNYFRLGFDDDSNEVSSLEGLLYRYYAPKTSIAL